jgi:hypothetical protein
VHRRVPARLADWRRSSSVFRPNRFLPRFHTWWYLPKVRVASNRHHSQCNGGTSRTLRTQARVGSDVTVIAVPIRSTGVSVRRRCIRASDSALHVAPRSRPFIEVVLAALVRYFGISTDIGRGTSTRRVRICKIEAKYRVGRLPPVARACVPKDGKMRRERVPGSNGTCPHNTDLH